VAANNHTVERYSEHAHVDNTVLHSPQRKPLGPVPNLNLRGAPIRFGCLCAAMIAAMIVGACASTPGRDRPLAMIVTTAFSPDGKLIGVASSEEEVALFDARPLTFRRTLTRDADRRTEKLRYSALIHSFFKPLPIAFSPDGALLVAAGVSAHFVEWDTATGTERFRVSAQGEVRDIAFLPDGRFFVTVGPDVEFHSAVDGGTEATLAAPTGASATAVAVAPDGLTVLVGVSTGAIEVIDATSRAILGMLHGHEAPVSALAFAPDGQSFASSAGGYDLRLWKRSDGADFSSAPAPAHAAPSNAGARAAGKLLWLLGSVSGARLVGAPTMGAPPIVPGTDEQLGRAAHVTPYHCGSRVAYSADGRYLASSANTLLCADCLGTLAPPFLVFVTDLEKGTTVGARGGGCAISIAPDGGILATGGTVGVPELRDAMTAKRLQPASAEK
jgi:WD40 repeat protein